MGERPAPPPDLGPVRRRRSAPLPRARRRRRRRLAAPAVRPDPRGRRRRRRPQGAPARRGRDRPVGRDAPLRDRPRARAGHSSSTGTRACRENGTSRLAPVVVRTTLVQSPSRRREQLLLVRATAPRDLALLGETTGAHPQLALIRSMLEQLDPRGRRSGGLGPSTRTPVRGRGRRRRRLLGDGGDPGRQPVRAPADRPRPARDRLLHALTNVIQARTTSRPARERTGCRRLRHAPGRRSVRHAGRPPAADKPAVTMLRWNGQSRKLEEVVILDQGAAIFMLAGSPQPIGFDESETSGFVPPALVWLPSANDAYRSRAARAPAGR